jgi:hypothetical protein
MLCGLGPRNAKVKWCDYRTESGSLLSMLYLDGLTLSMTTEMRDIASITAFYQTVLPSKILVLSHRLQHYLHLQERQYIFQAGYFRLVLSRPCAVEINQWLEHFQHIQPHLLQLHEGGVHIQPNTRLFPPLPDSL